MMVPTADTAPRLEDRFVSAFETYQGHALNGRSPRLQALRREAMDRFLALGFPGPKAEAWKYTPIARTLAHPYVPHLPAVDPALEARHLDAFAIPGLDAARLVLVDGRYVPALSDPSGLPEGVVVCGLAEAAESHTALFEEHFGRYARTDEAFTALNTAFARDGLFVHVPSGAHVERPLHLIHVLHDGDDRYLQPRHLLVVEDGARVTFLSTNHTLGTHRTFTSAVTECFVGRGAEATHYLVQDEGPDATLVNALYAHQEEGSRYTTLTVTLSGAVVRNDLHYRPDAEHCETRLYGLYLGRGSMHVDTHTLVDHARPHCNSNELYKGILDDDATGVFNGKVLVRPDAQQTNAYQSSKSVVLTERARMYAKPELEIYADDVKCSHGATTGQLDAEALFYLKSRGLPAARARALLLQAFARDVIERIHLAPLREHLDHVIVDRVH